MNISHLTAPPVLAPLYDLWRWIAPGPDTPAALPAAPTAHRACAPARPSIPALSTRNLKSSAPTALKSGTPRKPLRIIRVLESDHVPSNVGRMVISGRMADVCAELDRLADREQALH